MEEKKENNLQTLGSVYLGQFKRSERQNSLSLVREQFAQPSLKPGVGLQARAGVCTAWTEKVDVCRHLAVMHSYFHDVCHDKGKIQKERKRQ